MKITTRKLVISSALGAIAIVLAVSGVGLIPVPSLAGRATTMHIPAILGGILEGPLVGMLVGLIFGLFSFLNPGSPMSADPIVAVLPRIFIGLIAWGAFRLINRESKTTRFLALAAAGIVGTLTNTVGFLGLSVLRGYMPGKAALAVGAMHGVPEIIIAVVVTILVGNPLINYRKNVTNR